MPFLVLLFFLCLLAGPPFVVGWFFRRRFLRLTQILWATAALVGVVLCWLWLYEAGGWQRDAHLRDLSYFLERDTVTINRAFAQNEGEDAVWLYATAAPALARMAIAKSEQRLDLENLLYRMASEVADPVRFPVWNRRGNWDLHTFFLAHASIVLGEYQLLTGDERWAEQWQRACTFLANGIIKSRYKNLASRPNDVALRPADNAAGLYALQRYDRYYAEDLFDRTLREWAAYLDKELAYNYSHLPCSGFSGTDICRLPATGGNLALLTIYTAPGQAETTNDIWRDTKHYYKRNKLGVSARLRTPPPEGELPVDCNLLTLPLPCGAFTTELGQWAAASQGEYLPYYQFNNHLLWRDFFGNGFRAKDYAQLSFRQKLRALQQLAIRLQAETKL